VHSCVCFRSYPAQGFPAAQLAWLATDLQCNAATLPLCTMLKSAVLACQPALLLTLLMAAAFCIWHAYAPSQQGPEALYCVRGRMARQTKVQNVPHVDLRRGIHHFDLGRGMSSEKASPRSRACNVVCKQVAQLASVRGLCTTPAHVVDV
jgi:hypothetical protein